MKTMKICLENIEAVIYRRIRNSRRFKSIARAFAVGIAVAFLPAGASMGKQLL